MAAFPAVYGGGDSGSGSEGGDAVRCLPLAGAHLPAQAACFGGEGHGGLPEGSGEQAQRRVVIHYNGHGVPAPSQHSELWVLDQRYSQYIPLRVCELGAWVKAPVLFVFDVRCAAPLTAAVRSDPNVIVLAATSTEQHLPMNPYFPADTFTSCLLTPLRIAILFHFRYCTPPQGHLRGRKAKRGEASAATAAASAASDSDGGSSSGDGYSDDDFAYGVGSTITVNMGFAHILLELMAKDERYARQKKQQQQQPGAAAAAAAASADMNVDAESAELLATIAEEEEAAAEREARLLRTTFASLRAVLRGVLGELAEEMMGRTLHRRLVRDGCEQQASLVTNFILAHRVMTTLGVTPVCVPALPGLADARTALQHPLWTTWDHLLECTCSDLLTASLGFRRRRRALRRRRAEVEALAARGGRPSSPVAAVAVVGGLPLLPAAAAATAAAGRRLGGGGGGGGGRLSFEGLRKKL
eukprot:Rhum_TRINITY_DN14765_c7_g3::Rhum_TRINITY_DN14765_c7_g3_i4::g.114359::m.114359